jgi:para-nitrobenzyl esterase
LTTRRTIRTALTAALMMSAQFSSAMIPIGSDPVTTNSGRIAGTRLDSGVKAYLGIPYAQAPTGALRWAPPQANRWAGVWNADRRGPECIQVLRPHDINHYFGEEPSSENCLYMNLWAPGAARAGDKRPVVVFIYGGGYTVGSSGMANYDGENVARAGALFVNFNYRVGALGFLAHPELSREQGGHSGNYGLLDQVAALRWVHDNIARFGGDPDKVVIVGQSAGASSVASHVFSPLSRGLFRAAVMSSGCGFANNAPTLADGEKVGLQLQQRLGVTSLAALRNIPADRILAQQGETQLGVSVEGIRAPAGIIDGKMVVGQKSALLASGNFAKVPIIASYNGDDIDIAQNPISGAKNVADYRRLAAQVYGKAAPEFLALYPVRDNRDVVGMARLAAQDSGFEQRARQCADLALRHGNAPAYLDQFVRKHPYVPGVKIADQNIETIGAYHTADVPYWLGTLDKYNMFRPTRAWTAYDRRLSANMVNALIALANTGSPTTRAMPWPAWTPASQVKLVIGDRVSIAPLNVRRLDWQAAHPVVSQTPLRRTVRD